jgi:hypothetical protein
MERVDQDEPGAQLGCAPTGEPRQVVQVTVSPRILRAQRVQLDGEAPLPLGRNAQARRAALAAVAHVAAVQFAGRAAAHVAAVQFAGLAAAHFAAGRCIQIDVITSVLGCLLEDLQDRFERFRRHLDVLATPIAILNSNPGISRTLQEFRVGHTSMIDPSRGS